ncbi:MAG: radical SAM protein [Candidatus Omnitrophica bacterium]|nr:radical SAM protein [Candidatus Omnitrophota bacterium]
MTYWYPGVIMAIKLLKEVYPGVPVILGGIYASLSFEHAAGRSGADIVLRNFEIQKLNEILERDMDLSPENILNETIDFSWYPKSRYAVLKTSLGCPFNCSYCAQRLLNPEFMLKSIDKAVEEFKILYGMGIKNFAFYDDALLLDKKHITGYFEKILSLGMPAKFYTPNGLHAKSVSGEIAGLMRKLDFIKPILSLETTDPEKERTWHDKVSLNEFKNAVSFLKEAGYRHGEYSAYILLGAPGSDLGETKEAVDLVHGMGANVSLSEYSPVPGTSMGEGFLDAMAEPLLQNNSVFPALRSSDWESAQGLKNYARTLNSTWGFPSPDPGANGKVIEGEIRV